jgi:arylsulfatase A-like enzyme
MLAALDDSFARLVKKVKAKGMWNNTLIVVSTDNGGSMKKRICVVVVVVVVVDSINGNVVCDDGG